MMWYQQFYKNDDCLHHSDIGDVYWLNWHYTHKDFEGQGFGGKLLEHMIEILSTKARKFYVNMGWRLLNLRARQ